MIENLGAELGKTKVQTYEIRKTVLALLNCIIRLTYMLW